MDLHINRNVRAALYVGIVIGTPVITYLHSAQIIGNNEVGLWNALTMAVAAMAALNLTPKSME